MPHFPEHFQRWKRGEEKFLRKMIRDKDSQSQKQPVVPETIKPPLGNSKSKRNPSKFVAAKLPLKKRVITPPPTGSAPTQDTSPPENQKPKRTVTPPNDTSLLVPETPQNPDYDTENQSAGQTMSSEKQFRPISDSLLDSPAL